MKLRCFTSLVATMVMASTAVASEIYNKDGNILDMFGSLVGGHYFSKDNTKNGDNSFVRYGFSGTTYINDQIVGFGMWEHEISLKNTEGSIVNNNDKVLLGYAGIKFGNLGSIDYGRNYGVLYDVGAWTDVTPGFGGDILFVDNFLSNRSSNVITYRNKNFFGFVNGLDFALQYQGKNDVNKATGRTLKTANGEGYGVSASYSLDNGFAASLAYTNNKRIIEQTGLDSNLCCNANAEAYSLGIKYDGNGMYVAAICGETYNMTPFGSFCDSLHPEYIYGFVNKAKNIELVAQYQFGFGLRPSVSYLYSKANDAENDAYSNFLKKCVTVGTSYVFNKNICTTIDYRINLLHKDSFTSASQICTNNVIALGVAYAF